MTISTLRPLALAAALASGIGTIVIAQDGSRAGSNTENQDGFRFRSGVELINVTATVTDDHGRFVSGLRQEDFTVYDNGEPQVVSHFSSDRVPVSLGITLDTSGSMSADKMSSARGAIERLMDQMLGRSDEMFLLRFSNVAQLVQGWTNDRRTLSQALNGVYAGGGTALYDAIAEAVPVAQSGHNSKKALVVISDGNDTSSSTSVSELRRIIRESEVLVYAIGVDGDAPRVFLGRGRPQGLPVPLPLPIPIPGRGRGRPQFPPIGGGGVWARDNEHVNAGALRNITDDTGGRTEIVKSFNDLAGATSRIADELSKQYYLGYASSGKKDGKWHEIRVDVRDRNLRVRARRGYVAS